MKKLIVSAIVCLSVLFMYSCQNENVQMNEVSEKPTGQLANELSEEAAERILQDFITKSTLTTKTRANDVTIKSTKKRYAGTSTRSNDSSPVAFYDFSLETKDGKGFAIVCGDKRLPQVIAYTTKGALEEVATNENTYLANYLENLPEAVALLLANRNGIPDMNHRYIGGFAYEDVPNVAHSWETDSTKERVVFLQESVTWEQGAPYNKLIPKNPTNNQPYLVGCSNIACANIMAYYCYPEKYDWAALKEFRVVIEGYQPDAVITEAATLCKDLFTANKSTPEANGTSTKTTDVYNGLQSFGYVSNPVMDYSLDSIVTSLEHFYPIYMRGQDPKQTFGHAFVVRGYWEIIPKNPNLRDTTVSLGINWGWMGGFGDGFYLVQYASFNLASLGLYPRIFTDQGPEYSRYSYADKVKLITRIRPRGY